MERPATMLAHSLGQPGTMRNNADWRPVQRLMRKIVLRLTQMLIRMAIAADAPHVPGTGGRRQHYSLGTLRLKAIYLMANILGLFVHAWLGALARSERRDAPLQKVIPEI